jgi:predicted DsbA family dithiol-disulfide isomerase
MKVEIWSDVVCPWCWIGKRRLESALARFPHRDRVEVVFHSFELDPSAPRDLDAPTPDLLARKYGLGPAQLGAMLERVRGLGKAEGLEMKLEKTRAASTFEAHQLIHFAASKGKQLEMADRLFHAHFTDCAKVGDRATLAALAAEIGLDAQAATEALSGDAFADDVRADEARARALGVTGVPFYVFDGALGLSGAQSPEVLLDVLRKAWAQAPRDEVAKGEACDDDVCAT